MPLLMKQWIPVIDKRTTIVCLMAAGQIELVEDPFDTIAGDFMAPPAHIHCRSIVAPYLPGAINNIRREANTELQRRPKAQRRRGPNGEIGARIPPPSDTNLPSGYSRPGSAEAAWKPKTSKLPPVPKNTAKSGQAADVAARASRNLTGRQREAVSMYRGAVATAISGALRDQVDPPERFGVILDGVLEAFERVAELGQAVITYRGMVTSALPPNLVGMTVKDQGIMTTALQVGVVVALMSEETAVVEIIAGPATKAILQEPQTVDAPLLLPPGTRLRFIYDGTMRLGGQTVRYLKAVVVDG